MHFLTALAITSLLAAPSPSSLRGSSSVKRGKATASVKVDGSRAEVSVQQGRRLKTVGVAMELGSSCNAKKLSAVLAREVAENASAFRGLASKTTVRLPKGRAGLRNMERGIGLILGGGKHSRSGGSGFTKFGGFSVALGPLPGSGKSKTVERGRGGRGRTTKVTGLPRGGTKVVSEFVGASGVRDVTEVTLRGNGSVSMVRTWTSGTGAAGVTLSESSSFGSGGKRTGGLAKVHTGGGGVFSEDQSSGGGGEEGDEETEKETPNRPATNGLASEDQSSGSGGKTDTEPKPTDDDSGGETEEAKESSNETTTAPTMSSGAPTMSNGTLTIPGVSIGDSTVGSMINWNRLGAAVTTPDPTGNGESPHTGGNKRGDGGLGGGGSGGLGGCRQVEQAGFNPDPSFLKPSKRGWDIDYGPMLRGEGNGRKR